jgi:tRNA(Ile)-lysidine synthase
MNLLKEFQTYVAKEGLFEPKHKLLLAISGGLDSMVLLHLLKHLNYQVSCAHVNFQLRGEESNADAIFVKEYCHNLHIPFFETSFETKKYILESGEGTQEAARKLRYQWFNELLNAHSFDFVLTAHHANDQAETMLFNLFRGAGARGLSGILPKNNQLVRPLLFATKLDLEAYAHNNCIPYRSDSSNNTDDYDRNFIRHQIIPKVLEIKPGLIGTMEQNAKIMQATAHYFQEQISSIKKSICSSTNGNLIIDANKLIDLPFPAYVLFEIIQTYGFNISQCQQALEAFKSNNIGAIFKEKNARFLVDRTCFMLHTQTNIIQEATIHSLPFIYQVGNVSYTIEESPFSGFEDDVWWLNYSALTFPLTARAITHGDRFIPLGLNHHQKISDYLINKKVNLFAKEEAWVLTSDEQICFLAPFQISDAFKINSSNQQFVKISIKKEGQA